MKNPPPSVDEILTVYLSRLGQMSWTTTNNPQRRKISIAEHSSVALLLESAIREAYVRGATWGLEHRTLTVELKQPKEDANENDTDGSNV
jgi:hypothetical protein